MYTYGYFYLILQESIRVFEHPGFIMRLVLDKEAIKFEPEFNEYIDSLINIYEIMIKAVSFVPRVETKLYSQWVSNKDILIAALEVHPHHTSQPILASSRRIT
jgi:hypothetical protein